MISQTFPHSFQTLIDPMSLFILGHPGRLSENSILAYEKKQYAKLVIHLEDNELEVTRRMLNKPLEGIIRPLTRFFPPNLSHPRKSEDFMSMANGITIIVDQLREVIPEGIPSMRLWPGVDRRFLTMEVNKEDIRNHYGIDPSDFVLVYTGNSHKANAHEVREVYDAVIRLRQMGLPVTLLRTGRDYVGTLRKIKDEAKNYLLEMGHINYLEIPNVLACADLLVQPGKADKFNCFRFPSKLPEYLAMGKPVILPKCNIGLYLEHKEDALVFEDVDSFAIIEAVNLLRGNEELEIKLGVNARLFATDNFDWKIRSMELYEFYSQVTSA